MSGSATLSDDIAATTAARATQTTAVTARWSARRPERRVTSIGCAGW